MSGAKHWLALILVLASFADRSSAEIQYSRDIQPILSENCFVCHGPDSENRAADLRLDVREEAIKTGALVPGMPQDSRMVARIISTDDADRMPPPKSHKQLTNRQKQVLQTWIAEGGIYETHWAFQPIRRPPLPSVENQAWPRNGIDHFILATLEQQHLTLTAMSAPETLMRRVSLGLTGLPPTPENLDSFLSNHDDDAYAALLDRLLASPQYGERWARHWMDLVRYADSAGFELDYLFTHAWQYRDWLVRSFSQNKPMDRLIQEQIAGDQLQPDSEDAQSGTFFLTLGPMRFEGGIQRSKERENEWYTDLADTTGSVFLGLTLGCARCHDHKFDPLTQADYYGFQAIFADSELQMKRIDEGGGNGDTRPAFIRVAQRQEAGVVNVLRRGEPDLPLYVASAALPAVLTKQNISADKNRRAALAHWLTSAENPLTARVLVNRVWQWHFGQGLVRTPSDFGRQGAPPTHPQLLDWLASELIDSGWNLHRLQRLILESSTYRQASLASSASLAADPNNHWLSYFPRRRLEAEELRDTMLAVTGVLNLQLAGPPVVPPLEASSLASLRNKNWQPTEDPRELSRRSLYFVVRRSIKLPFFESFNSPDNVSSCFQRDKTVVASQALTLFNSEFSVECARELAARLWKQTGGDSQSAASVVWKLLFSRKITADELSQAVAFLQAREQSWTTGSAEKHNLFVGIEPLPAAARAAAWVEWCLALLNANEFIYVD